LAIRELKFSFVSNQKDLKMKKFIVTTWIMFIGVSLSLAQEIIPNQIIVRITEDAKIQDVI